MIARLTGCLLVRIGVLVLAIALGGCAVVPKGAKEQAEAVGPTVGVFYFPGWKEGAKGLAYPNPWGQIRPHPKLEPMLGWYREGEVSVMDRQLQWMRDYRIGFVAFDWYWNGRDTYLEHAIQAYFQAEHRSGVPFSLLWANHDKQPASQEAFDSMVRYWLQHYFWRPEYQRIDGKPVVFVFSARMLEQDAQRFKSNTRALLDRADALARSAGLAGIYFVGGVGGSEWGATAAIGKSLGYSAYSAYNYHAGPAGKTRGEHRYSRSYAELDESYQEHWAWFSKHSDLPYIVPLTSGWDKRPWGGSKDPAHDLSGSTPADFKRHLEAARQFLSEHPGLTMNMGVICCWNEYGEGSIVEPTVDHGFQYLEAVKQTFRATFRGVSK